MASTEAKPNNLASQITLLHGEALRIIWKILDKVDNKQKQNNKITTEEIKTVRERLLKHQLDINTFLSQQQTSLEQMNFFERLFTKFIFMFHHNPASLLPFIETFLEATATLGDVNVDKLIKLKDDMAKNGKRNPTSTILDMPDPGFSRRTDSQ
jgi:hypothetical protein